MVQAGKGTDAVIDELVEVFEPGDIIVDGGNALFTDTIRREKAVRETGINFVGAGISGGEEGALNGPSIMPGGSAEAWVRPSARSCSSIAAVAEGEPCVTHVGTDGAGHFVKMIHNGIEYADMQLIAEAYDLIRRGTGKTPAEIADVFAEWNKGELESYLIEITAEVLRQVDAETGKPLVDVILDQAGAEGHRRLDRADRARPRRSRLRHRRGRLRRARSSKPARAAGRRHRDLPGPPTTLTVADPDAFIEDVRQALYASKIIAYSQGFDAIVAGAEQYGWDIKKGDIATIWRGGCIIRAQFLNRITEAYAADPGLVALVTAPYFADAVARAQESWRRVVAMAAQAGIPSPGVLVVAGLLRRSARRAPAGRPRAGAARLLRRAHLQARRQAGHLPHPVVGRPHRDRSTRHALVDPFVWAIQLSPQLGDDAGLATLSPTERRRFDGTPPGTRDSFLAGRVLLRRLVATQLGIEPDQVPLTAVCPDCGGPHGRPVVEGSELRVSLARCDVGVVAVAAWGRELGVDVEPTADAERSELAIRSVAGGEGLAHWTRVEATLKADGRGLRVDPREVRITGSGAELEARVADRPTRYRILEPALHPELQVSVAIAS